MWCIVNLPNGTQQAVKWDSKAIGQECLEKVCKALGIICEMEYFGLEYWSPNQKESRSHNWINLRNRLSCDGSSMQLMLALRVKFWVPVHSILQENVRNIFYSQAKMDLLEGRLNANDWTNAAKLAALLCQGDGLCFNEQSLKSECPMQLKKEQALLKQQQKSSTKERKEKEYTLSFKKRRLTKQKSTENVNNELAVTLAAPSFSEVPNCISILSSTACDNAATPASISSCLTTPTCLNTSESINLNLQQNCADIEMRIAVSPLRVYQDYIVRVHSDGGTYANIPVNFLRQIAEEHGKLSSLKMSSKAAKYWLLKEFQNLQGYGEEFFSGVFTGDNPTRCDIAVGSHGISVNTKNKKYKILFNAIATAKSFRRIFKLEYVDENNHPKDLEIKLPKHAIAAGLYRSITERHAFYVCDKVRCVVTNQFTRDLKGTIASMFKEDTELGKRYVFDIQHTCREVHDHARRILHDRGIEAARYAENVDRFYKIGYYLPKSTIQCSHITPDDTSSLSCSALYINAESSFSTKLDFVIHEKKEREAVIEHCVDKRISEAMTCKICMDSPINAMFSPCSHVTACLQCAARCTKCPNCRMNITNVVKIFLPPELRQSQPSNDVSSNSANKLPYVDNETKDRLASTLDDSSPKIATVT